jgi:transposase-like protein
MVYPSARHQLCLAHWFRHLEALTPPLAWFQRRKLRREFWWIWEADSEGQALQWARRFCARWRWVAPEMVEKFQQELTRVLAFLAFPALWRHRLRTTNLGEGWFRHLRRYLSRFPGCRDAQHSEQVLGCFLLAAEQMHR